MLDNARRMRLALRPPSFQYVFLWSFVELSAGCGQCRCVLVCTSFVIARGFVLYHALVHLHLCLNLCEGRVAPLACLSLSVSSAGLCIRAGHLSIAPSLLFVCFSLLNMRTRNQPSMAGVVLSLLMPFVVPFPFDLGMRIAVQLFLLPSAFVFTAWLPPLAALTVAIPAPPDLVGTPFYCTHRRAKWTCPWTRSLSRTVQVSQASIPPLEKGKKTTTHGQCRA